MDDFDKVMWPDPLEPTKRQLMERALAKPLSGDRQIKPLILPKPQPAKSEEELERVGAAVSNTPSVWIIEWSPTTGRDRGKWYVLTVFADEWVPPFGTRQKAKAFIRKCRLQATPRYRAVRYVREIPGEVEYE